MNQRGNMRLEVGQPIFDETLLCLSRSFDDVQQVLSLREFNGEFPNTAVDIPKKNRPLDSEDYNPSRMRSAYSWMLLCISRRVATSGTVASARCNLSMK